MKCAACGDTKVNPRESLCDGCKAVSMRYVREDGAAKIAVIQHEFRALLEAFPVIAFALKSAGMNGAEENVREAFEQIRVVEAQVSAMMQ